MVELRYFGGLSELEIAGLLERSERSIRRDWQKARMFLLASLKGSLSPARMDADRWQRLSPCSMRCWNWTRKRARAASR